MKIKTIIFSLLFVLFIIGCSNEKTSKQKQEAINWLQNLSKLNKEKAIANAKSLTGELKEFNYPDKTTKFFSDNDINPSFLNSDFNKLDFQYWLRHFYLNRIATKITKNIIPNNNKKIIRKLYNTVKKRIKNESIKEDKTLWPSVIWGLKKGVSDRQAWLLSELAYQLGYETQIVYLMNEKRGVSNHTICEIRKNDKVWTADPHSGKLLYNVSIEDLASNKKLAKEMWPDKKLFRRIVKNPIFYLPAYPQDYCKRNQKLHKKLKKLLKEKCPRFGEKPSKRLKEYLSLTNKKEKQFKYRLWFYPLRLLHQDMMKSANR